MRRDGNEQEPVIAYFPGDDLLTPGERRKGLPIGNLTSQFFANVYLNRFDHFVKEILRCKFYLRYVDDSVALGNDKAWLWEIKAQMEKYLAPFRLRLHEHKCQVRRTDDGVTFLGFRVFPQFRLLPRENAVRIRRRRRFILERRQLRRARLAGAHRLRRYVPFAGTPVCRLSLSTQFVVFCSCSFRS